MEDWKQLAEYVKTGSECAFESVVHQHLQMVYATALRKTGNRDMAEEVAQSTFILLTRKAAQLKPSGALGAWLHQTALFKSQEHLKKTSIQAKRLRMLKETVMPNFETKDEWEPILPMLDDAVERIQPGLPKPLLTAMDLMPIFGEIKMPVSENKADAGLQDSFRDWTRNLMESTQGVVLREDMTTQLDHLKTIHPDLYKQWIEGLIKQDSNWKEMRCALPVSEFPIHVENATVGYQFRHHEA